MAGILMVLTTLLFTTACIRPQSIFSNDFVKLRVLLVDAPNDKAKNVYVNVDEIQMLTVKDGKEKSLIISKNLGSVDLLALSKGTAVKVSELMMESDLQIKEIRMLLRDSGNYLVKHDGTRCELKRPKPEQQPLKVKIWEEVKLRAGFDYTMTIDFDGMASVELKTNGDCYLHSILNLKSFKKNIAELKFDPEAEVEEDTEALMVELKEDEENQLDDNGLMDKQI